MSDGRGDGPDPQAPVGDQEGVLVRAVQRTAVLHHAHPPGGDLVVHPVVEDDHAVGGVLLDAVPRQLPFPATLAGDHRGELVVLQPPQQPGELVPHDRLVAQGAEQHLDRVQDHSPGAHRLHRGRQADEQAVEVEVARRHDLGRIDPDRIDDQAPVGLESGQVEAERGHVRRQVGGRLLERQQDARLVELLCTAHQELQPEQRLARTRASGDQGRPAARQPTAGELVEPPDARRRLGQRGSDGRRRPGRVDRRRHVASRVDLIKLVAMTRSGGRDQRRRRRALRRASLGCGAWSASISPRPLSTPKDVARAHRAIEPLHSHLYFAPEHDEHLSRARAAAGPDGVLRRAGRPRWGRSAPAS